MSIVHEFVHKTTIEKTSAMRTVKCLFCFVSVAKDLLTHNTWRVSLLYESLNVYWRLMTRWRSLCTMNNYKISHPNELWSDSSDHFAEQRTSHTDHKERVSPQYALLNGEQGQMTDWMIWNNENNYEVSLLYGPACGHAAGLILWMI